MIAVPCRARPFPYRTRPSLPITTPRAPYRSHRHATRACSISIPYRTPPLPRVFSPLVVIHIRRMVVRLSVGFRRVNPSLEHTFDRQGRGRPWNTRHRGVAPPHLHRHVSRSSMYSRIAHVRDHTAPGAPDPHMNSARALAERCAGALRSRVKRHLPQLVSRTMPRLLRVFVPCGIFAARSPHSSLLACGRPRHSGRIATRRRCPRAPLMTSRRRISPSQQPFV